MNYNNNNNCQRKNAVTYERTESFSSFCGRDKFFTQLCFSLFLHFFRINNDLSFFFPSSFWHDSSSILQHFLLFSLTSTLLSLSLVESDSLYLAKFLPFSPHTHSHTLLSLTSTVVSLSHSFLFLYPTLIYYFFMGGNSKVREREWKASYSPSLSLRLLSHLPVACAHTGTRTFRNV